MQIYTDELSITWPDGNGSPSEVVTCKDSVSGVELLTRVFADGSERTAGTISHQFNLHRMLSSSGVVAASDLALRSGRVVGYTMPRLPGISLLKAKASLDDESLLTVILDMSFAIFSIHALGYIHSDISPENTWIECRGPRTSATLIDLGSVSSFGSRNPTHASGTEGFIAPERRRGGPSHPSTDAYSFGKVVELLIPMARDASVVDALMKLAHDCTLTNVPDRLSDFGHIYARILRTLRMRVDEDFPHTPYLVPLRSIALATRVRSLRGLIDTQVSGGIVLVTGARQSGISEILRATSASLQLDGKKIIRYTGVTQFDELNESISGMSNQHVALRNSSIFVETDQPMSIDHDTLVRVEEVAAECQAVIVIESRNVTEIVYSNRLAHYEVRPLTVRESIQATSHLVIPAGNIGPHGDAIWSVTGGLPGVLKSVMTDYVRSGRRSRGEPLDFGRYAGGHYVHGQSTSRGNSGQAVSFMALQAKRRSIASAIAEIRRVGGADSTSLLLACSTIAESYAELGSPRRQSRWARRGVTAIDVSALSTSNPGTMDKYLNLTSVCLPPLQRVDILRKLELDTSSASKLTQLSVKSELGAAYLLAKRPTEATRPLFEAMALARQDGASSPYLARLLNRLGTAKMLTGDFDLARRYLGRSSKVAKSTGDRGTAIRIEGNLGLISLYCGEPAAGAQTFQSLRRTSARSKNYSEYLSHVLNETVCLLELGRGLAAERRARLAVILGEMLSDDMLLAYAYNNLGWILMTQCHASSASSFLRKSLYLRERSADIRGTGDNLSNLARLYLLARNYSSAAHFLQEAEDRYRSAGHFEGVWDCSRIRARSALLQEDYDLFRQHLAAIPIDSKELPDKDRAEVLLLQTEGALWLTDTKSASASLKELDSMPLVSRINPLAARRRLMDGHVAMIEGDLDGAIFNCNAAAEQFRKANREDLLMDALMVLAILAAHTRNTAAGLRNLEYVEKITSTMKGELGD